MTIQDRFVELVSRCVECGLAEPESLASLGGSAPGVVDGILSRLQAIATTVDSAQQLFISQRNFGQDPPTQHSPGGASLGYTLQCRIHDLDLTGVFWIISQASMVQPERIGQHHVAQQHIQILPADNGYSV